MKIILASHGRLALGMQDTLNMIVGRHPNLYAYAAYLDGNETNYLEEICGIIDSDSREQVVIVTDILGGSVNTNIIQLLERYHNLRVIAGMNLPLVMELVMGPEQPDEVAFDAAINHARESIVDVNSLLLNQTTGEEDL